MKNPFIKFLLLSILLFTFAFPAFAWDDSGHKLVAYIAWQQMSPEAREKAINILLNAPEDAQLNALYPTPPDEDFTTYPIGARSKAAKQRDYFMIVAYWADIVRNRKYEKRYKYHHGTWHYLDTYWRDSNGKIETIPDMENDKENVVERLFEFDKVLRSDAKDAEKAIALAWILHLSGDVHQPLHASGRVTAEEPKGDQGGNTFSLSPKDAPRKENLHWYWDSIVVRTVPRKNDATDADYLLPIGNAIMKKYPLAKMQNRLEIGKFDAWQQESFRIASTRLYPKTLIRNQMPSAAYNKMAFGIAEEQIALAGYRLGAWLNQIFGNRTALQNQTDRRKEIEQNGAFVGQGQDDVEIWFKIRKALIDAPDLRDSTIGFNVVNNVITLRGTVSNKANKGLAEQTVKKIEGVKSVKNELKVITK
jgi:osmotically-inducible protein OsmY